jgi:hypothetical protein
MFSELAAQPNQPIELLADLSKAHVNVHHARFMGRAIPSFCMCRASP